MLKDLRTQIHSCNYTSNLNVFARRGETHELPTEFRASLKKFFFNYNRSKSNHDRF
ncbi:hypothetical protein PUN28_000442 [Cardiocondyla obscurior]|uniref:Uncharacterized protein n=1 Tax=Cardiocondyla obscurior TaxID=286306 RepID=A0AAW2GZK2_9HYME